MTRSLCQEVTKNWHSIPSNRTTACSGSNVSVDLGIVSLTLGNSRGCARAHHIRHHHRRHGKCQPPLLRPAGQGDDPTPEGEVRLGVSLPWGQHRRGGNRGPPGHRPRPGGEFTTATARVPASTTRWWARRWPPSGAARPWTSTGRTPSRRTSAGGKGYITTDFSIMSRGISSCNFYSICA